MKLVPESQGLTFSMVARSGASGGGGFESGGGGGVGFSDGSMAAAVRSSGYLGLPGAQEYVKDKEKDKSRNVTGEYYPVQRDNGRVADREKIMEGGCEAEVIQRRDSAQVTTHC